MKIVLLILFLNPDSMGVAGRVEISHPMMTSIEVCQEIVRNDLHDFMKDQGYIAGGFIVATSCYGRKID